uniref:G-protein coupled receptors family 1 profile domain-containing protein n=1 Tax=Anopheles dirus TaxID=7168 RepID=A0A182N402_9DIPT
VSVSVAVWTLVAISLERYFAICRPLSSRRWQTQFHAYKMIGLVWTVSFLANSPLCYVQRLQPVLRAGRSTGQMKCREVWPDRVSEKAYVLFHDVGLLFLPLLTMGFAYSMIVSKLWRGLRHEIKHCSLYQQSSKQAGHAPTGVGGNCGGSGGGVGGVTNATGMAAATGAIGGEQLAHPTTLGTAMAAGQMASDVESGKPLKMGGGSGKRIEQGFLLTSSLKKRSFKTTTAVVNFACNNNTTVKGNFNCDNNGGNVINRCNSTTNGAGGTGSANLCSSSMTGSSTGNAACESKAGKLRGFRHFFVKHHHGALCRNQRYQLGGTSPEGLPELVETKFDNSHTHQQQQHPYHHHCHHPHAYHHQHQHLNSRIPTTIVKSTLQDAKHEIVLSTADANPLEPASSDAVLLPGAGSTSGVGGG